MQHKKKRCDNSERKLITCSSTKQAITQATTNDNVDQEQNSGTSTITGIQPEVTKSVTRKAIDDEVVAKATIDTVADATDEEKRRLKIKLMLKLQSKSDD